jgi:hypothetical protein
MLRINNYTGVIVGISTYVVFVNRRLCCILCILQMSRVRMVTYCYGRLYRQSPFSRGRGGGRYLRVFQRWHCLYQCGDRLIGCLFLFLCIYDIVPRYLAYVPSFYGEVLLSFFQWDIMCVYSPEGVLCRGIFGNLYGNLGHVPCNRCEMISQFAQHSVFHSPNRLTDIHHCSFIGCACRDVVSMSIQGCVLWSKLLLNQPFEKFCY